MPVSFIPQYFVAVECDTSTDFRPNKVFQGRAVKYLKQTREILQASPSMWSVLTRAMALREFVPESSANEALLLNILMKNLNVHRSIKYCVCLGFFHNFMLN